MATVLSSTSLTINGNSLAEYASAVFFPVGSYIFTIDPNYDPNDALPATGAVWERWNPTYIGYLVAEANDNSSNFGIEHTTNFKPESSTRSEYYGYYWRKVV